MPHSDIRTTIVIVPRESFDMLPDVVERLYRVTPPIFKLLIMEGRAPTSIRKRLQAIERVHASCRIVWSDRWLYPHEAVNQSLPLIDTEYVVYLDNDVEVMDGWLSALVACADDERAGCVHPIYLTTSLNDTTHTIHVAEGRLVREQRNGHLFVDSVMPYSGTRLEDYPDRRRKPSEFFEWHCVLFRKSLLDKVGPLDDLTIAEHLDYVLRMEQAGERILLEPHAVVAYDYERIFELRGEDRQYFLYRWGVAKAAQSLERLRAKWNFHPDSTARRLYWVKEHTGRVRQTFLLPRLINKVRRTIGLANMAYVRGSRPQTLAENTAE